MKTNKKKAIRMGLAVTATALFWGGMYLLFGNDAAQKMEWNQIKDYAPDFEVCETLDEAVAETGNIPVVATATTQMLTAQVQQMNANYANAIGWIYVPDTHINYPSCSRRITTFICIMGQTAVICMLVPSFWITAVTPIFRAFPIFYTVTI